MALSVCQQDFRKTCQCHYCVALKNNITFKPQNIVGQKAQLDRRGGGVSVPTSDTSVDIFRHQIFQLKVNKMIEGSETEANPNMMSGVYTQSRLSISRSKVSVWPPMKHTPLFLSAEFFRFLLPARQGAKLKCFQLTNLNFDNWYSFVVSVQLQPLHNVKLTDISFCVVENLHC